MELNEFTAAASSEGGLTEVTTGMPRLMDRSSSFFQSFGRLNVRRLGTTRRLKWDSWYHWMLSQETSRLLVIGVSIYLSIVIVYAGLYRAIAHSCGLKATTFRRSFYLSIETITTLGYGVPDPYYNDCVGGVFVLTSQLLIGLIFEIVLTGVIFARIARPTRRAATIVFSNKAVLREHDGKWYFQLQVTDQRNHQLVEAHIRLYAFRDVTIAGSTVNFQGHFMRLQHPDDELGGMLMLFVPQTVVHRIDAWSPLMPPHLATRKQEGNATTTSLFPDILQRQADLESGSREIRGEDPGRPISREDLVQFWRNSHLEIVCLVEGIDSLTGNTIQARHSYRLEDLEWNSRFGKCVFRSTEGSCVIDFDRFHVVEPANAPEGTYEPLPQSII